MRLATFEVSGWTAPRVGAVPDDQVIGLGAALEVARRLRFLSPATLGPFAARDFPGDLIACLAEGEPLLDPVRRLLEVVAVRGAGAPEIAAVCRPVSGVRLRAPVLRPSSLRDCLAFETHMRDACRRRGIPEIPRLWYEIPVYYKGNPCGVIGHGDPVLWPRYSEKLDFELELGVVISRKAKNVTPEEARRIIGGYTIFNDFLARDIQLKEMSLLLGPSKGKDFDNGSAIGPWLVTPDELDVRDLRMQARVNGETWSEGSSGTMYWTFEKIISYISQDETLYPGDFIGSGTVGKGCGADLDRWIRPGDIVELEVSGIGTLGNPVVKPASP